jgi:hypothetical protein
LLQKSNVQAPFPDALTLVHSEVACHDPNAVFLCGHVLVHSSDPDIQVSPACDVSAGIESISVSAKTEVARENHMESKYRYRLLIYFAALVLCLSICFANAEEIHPAAALQTATSEQFVFQGSQTHATFMPALHLAFVYEATAAATDAPVVSQSMLQQVTTDTQKSHRLSTTPKSLPWQMRQCKAKLPKQVRRARPNNGKVSNLAPRFSWVPQLVIPGTIGRFPHPSVH